MAAWSIPKKPPSLPALEPLVHRCAGEANRSHVASSALGYTSSPQRDPTWQPYLPASPSIKRWASTNGKRINEFVGQEVFVVVREAQGESIRLFVLRSIR